MINLRCIFSSEIMWHHIQFLGQETNFQSLLASNDTTNKMYLIYAVFNKSTFTLIYGLWLFENLQMTI